MHGNDTIRIFCANLRRAVALGRQLELARKQLSDWMPLQPDIFDPETMDPAVTLALDGFRARFSDLQDILGRALFKSLTRLEAEEAPGNELTMRQRLALMEKWGILELEQWEKLREIRNDFAHEYPDQHRKKALALNAAWEGSRELLQIVNRIHHHLRQRHPELSCD